jgi:hypothetical protein
MGSETLLTGDESPFLAWPHQLFEQIVLYPLMRLRVKKV